MLAWIPVLLLRLLAAAVACLNPFTAALHAELDVQAVKEFTFRDYSLRGDFNQFIHDHPEFLERRGLDQSLQLSIRGTIGDRVYVDLSMDDSLERDEDERFLIEVDGRVWDVTLGRLKLRVPGNPYMIFDREVLGVVGEGTFGKTRLMVGVGRPEGRSARNVFKGQGMVKEYVLSDSDGGRNPPVVEGSEHVFLDGRPLARGRDYEMDYEEGTLILDDSLLPVEETSIVMVEFETLRDGSTRKSTIAAFRIEHRLRDAPEAGKSHTTDRFASSYVNPYAPNARRREETKYDYAAIDLAAELEDTPSEDSQEATTGTSGAGAGRAARHLLAGFDARFHVARDRVGFETHAAFSSRITSAPGGPNTEGVALDVTMTHDLGALSGEVRYRSLDEGFEAIGKKEFVRFGNTSDLLGGPVRKLTVSERVALGAEAVLHSELSDAWRRDEDETEHDFESSLNVLSWKSRTQRRKVELRSYEEEESPSGRTIKRRGADFERRLHGVTIAASLEGEERTGFATSTSEEDFMRFDSAVSGGGDRLGWRLAHKWSRKDTDLTEGASESTYTAVEVKTLGAGRISGRMTLGRRTEKTRNAPDGSVEGNESYLGSGNLRMDLSSTLTLSAKLNAEQKRRILYVDDDRDPLNSLDSRDETTATIVMDNPILSREESVSLEWEPDRRLYHTLDYTFRSEKDLVTGKLYSRSEGWNGRLQYSPSPRLKTSVDYAYGENFNLTSALRNTDRSQGVELEYNFDDRCGIKLSRTHGWTKDLLDPTKSSMDSTSRVETSFQLSRSLELNAALGRKRREDTASSTEYLLEGGAAWTPGGGGTRLELTLSRGTTSGLDYTGEPFSSRDRRVEMRLERRMDEEAVLNGSLKYVDKGPDGRGGTGYEALVSSVEVKLEF